MRTKLSRTVACAIASLALAAASVTGVEAQALQEKLAAAGQAAAENQKALRSYTWIEKTELSLKGEVKTTKVASCVYGADGKVQKTPVSEPPPAAPKRGLRGRAVAKKTGEMKAEIESAGALVHQYVPPSPDKMQVVINAGKASLAQGGPGVVVLRFPDYEKGGDSLTLTFDTAVKALRGLDVATFMDDRSPVTLKVGLQSLPEGTSYPATVALRIPASQIEVKITNSNYRKVAQ